MPLSTGSSHHVCGTLLAAGSSTIQPLSSREAACLAAATLTWQGVHLRWTGGRPLHRFGVRMCPGASACGVCCAVPAGPCTAAPGMVMFMSAGRSCTASVCSTDACTGSALGESRVHIACCPQCSVPSTAYILNMCHTGQQLLPQTQASGTATDSPATQCSVRTLLPLSLHVQQLVE